jgi:hypothetical protein
VTWDHIKHEREPAVLHLQVAPSVHPLLASVYEPVGVWDQLKRDIYFTRRLGISF